MKATSQQAEAAATYGQGARWYLAAVERVRLYDQESPDRVPGRVWSTAGTEDVSIDVRTPKALEGQDLGVAVFVEGVDHQSAEVTEHDAARAGWDLIVAADLIRLGIVAG